MPKLPFAALLAALVVLPMAALPAAAQPFAWVINTPRFSSDTRLAVIDLANGVTTSSLNVTGVGASAGTLTPDAKYYLLATTYGLARFETSTRLFVGLWGPARPVIRVWVSPSGMWMHTLGPDGAYRILDATTGAIVAERCCAAVDLAFSRDGAIRYEIQPGSSAATTIVRARPDTPHSEPIWETTIPGEHARRGPGPAAVTSPADVIVPVGPALVVLAAANGEQRATINVTGRAGWACCYGNSVVISSWRSGPSTSPPWVRYSTLSRIDLNTLATTVVRETLTHFNMVGEVFLSSDTVLAYWVNEIHPYLGTPSRGFTTVELATGETHGGGALGWLYDFDVEPGTQCLFDPLPAIAVPPGGGVFAFGVAPRGPCDGWTAVARAPHFPHVLTPGPHLGAATIRVAVPANSGWESRYAVLVGGKSILLDQAAAAPNPPFATHDLDGNRVTVSWAVGAGAVPAQFIIRGGVFNGGRSDVATVAANVRSWTSPPLPPGSYSVEVAARNNAGTSAASNRLSFSIGIAEVPAAPTNLQAVVQDDAVRLTWEAALTGAPPGSHLIEAAPAGSVAFAAIAHVNGTSLSAIRVPAGPWLVRVRAVTAGGVSPPSNTVTITPAPCSAAPTAPRDLQATSAGGLTTLRWTAPASGSAQEYLLDGGSRSGLTDLGPVAVAAPSLAFDLAIPAGAYYVRVRARNSCGDSGPSNEVLVLVQ